MATKYDNRNNQYYVCIAFKGATVVPFLHN